MTARNWRRRPYESEDDRTQALAEFLNYYNFERKHSALGWLPPITRVPLLGPKVLPQESDLPEVTDTQLSIFDDLGGV